MWRAIYQLHIEEKSRQSCRISCVTFSDKSKEEEVTIWLSKNLNWTGCKKYRIHGACPADVDVHWMASLRAWLSLKPRENKKCYQGNTGFRRCWTVAMTSSLRSKKSNQYRGREVSCMTGRKSLLDTKKSFNFNSCSKHLGIFQSCTDKKNYYLYFLLLTLMQSSDRLSNEELWQTFSSNFSP